MTSVWFNRKFKDDANAGQLYVEIVTTAFRAPSNASVHGARTRWPIAITL